LYNCQEHRFGWVDVIGLDHSFEEEVLEDTQFYYALIDALE